MWFTYYNMSSCEHCPRIDLPTLREDCKYTAEEALTPWTSLRAIRVTGCCNTAKITTFLTELLHNVFQRMGNLKYGMLVLVDHTIAETLRSEYPQGVATCTPMARGAPVFVVPRGGTALERVIQAIEFLEKYEGNGIVLMSHSRLKTKEIVHEWCELITVATPTVVAPTSMSSTCAQLVMHSNGQQRPDSLVLYSMESKFVPLWWKAGALDFVEFGGIEVEESDDDDDDDDDDMEVEQEDSTSDSSSSDDSNDDDEQDGIFP